MHWLGVCGCVAVCVSGWPPAPQLPKGYYTIFVYNIVPLATTVVSVHLTQRAVYYTLGWSMSGATCKLCAMRAMCVWWCCIAQMGASARSQVAVGSHGGVGSHGVVGFFSRSVCCCFRLQLLLSKADADSSSALLAQKLWSGCWWLLAAWRVGTTA